MSTGRAIDFAAATAFGAIAAALAGGAWESLWDQGDLLLGAAAVGFLAFIAIPIGAALSGIGRLLWRSWRPHELGDAMRDPETGGMPRLAAWLIFLLLASIGLAALVLQGMNRVALASSARVVHILSAPILAVGGALFLVAISRPLVLAIARGLAAADRRWHARRGGSFLRPRVLAAATGTGGAILLVAAWTLVIRPQVGHLDLSFLPSVAIWFAVLVAAPFAWALLASRPRARLALLAGCGTASLLAIAGAMWMRAQRPYQMLAIWGESRLAGLAIDWLYDVEGLRGDLDLASFRPLEQPGAPHHDIILVTIDTVRADRTPPYGGAADMPTLARLGREGAVFQWAFAPGNVTRRSLPSMMIGVSSPRLRGRVTGWALKLDPRHVLLAERLRAAGYETAGFFCCTSQFGAQHRLGLVRGIEHVVIEKDGEELAGMAAAWLRGRRQRPAGRPLFLWAHLIEPHGWEKTHPAVGEARRRTQRYDLSLTDADRALDILLRGVDDANRTRTYVIVTSDHGEALGDHGSKNHAETLFNAEIRVPLVVAGPGVAARRIHRPVGLSDLAPSIIDLAGLVPPGMPQMDGESFAPVARGAAAHGIENGGAYAAMISDRSVASSARALIEGRYKVIARGRKLELFDYVADPGELVELSGRHPQVLERLGERLEERRALDEVDPF